ncbi:MAG: AbrB family transcriptional regulator [Ruminococcaceae bacterium]|nr:AbrB family transcriptional regulator [Oscillospiraceae bacterium]
MDNNHSFEYNYSAAQKQEVEAIRKKYLPKEEDKMEQLRRLHHSATQKAQAASIALGIIGTLIFGLGLSLCLTELSGFLGGTAMFVGIPVGLGGLVMLALAYPVYNTVLRRERKKIAPEILRLTEELLK